MRKSRSACIALVLFHWAWETWNKWTANYWASVNDAKSCLIWARKGKISRGWGTTCKGTCWCKGVIWSLLESWSNWSRKWEFRCTWISEWIWWCLFVLFFVVCSWLLLASSVTDISSQFRWKRRRFRLITWSTDCFIRKIFKTCKPIYFCIITVKLRGWDMIFFDKSIRSFIFFFDICKYLNLRRRKWASIIIFHKDIVNLGDFMSK
jgi:hypothetical protein